jgi:hypothetical protein
MDTCLSAETQRRLLAGSLPPDEASACREHLRGCAACRDLLDRHTDNTGLRRWTVLAQQLPVGRAEGLQRLLRRLHETPPSPLGTNVGRTTTLLHRGLVRSNFLQDSGLRSCPPSPSFGVAWRECPGQLSVIAHDWPCLVAGADQWRETPRGGPPAQVLRRRVQRVWGWGCWASSCSACSPPRGLGRRPLRLLNEWPPKDNAGLPALYGVARLFT